MSTNKTTNYQLHKWEADDDFLRTEFNENFAKLDEHLRSRGTLVLGSYKGNDTYPRRIELGAPIKFLLLENTTGSRHSYTSSAYLGGFLFPGFKLPNDALTLDGTGFILGIDANYHNQTNSSEYTFLYLALLDMPE